MIFGLSMSTHGDPPVSVVELRAQVASHSKYLSIYSDGSSARHLYRAAAKPGEAAQLCVFVLGMWYLWVYVLLTGIKWPQLSSSE